MIAPIVRAALRQSMQLLGHAFIVGETIDAALARGRSEPGLALCSFDVLGEGARTELDAQRYYDSYAHAIGALGAQAAASVHARSGISVKLSALEPRYTQLQSARVNERLSARMLELARRAARAGIGFTIDAEEADRLDLSLDIVETLARDPATRSWQGLGLAVQAYGRRAPLVLDWVAALARDSARRMTVRLVKGAYWDSEIKRAQERGLASFPVYTSKAATDASYLECARQLFAAGEVIYPQFATHNAYTVAAVLELASASAAYEFQRLHGMGEALYEAARAEVPALPPVRVYALVGTHEDLLPYLVRRLLENGANSSFVHQFINPQIPVEQVVRDPVSSLTSNASRPTRVREPRALFGAGRANSEGQDFGDPAALATLQALVQAHAGETYVGGPILSGRRTRDAATPVTSPADTRETVGLTRDASAAQMRHALQAAQEAQPHWDARPAAERAACLTRAAARQLTPADGPAFGKVALTHPALAGVAFTGSTATAATINRTLANRDGAIVPLIAETGGVNAMVVDATALPEQVVDDVITSAFTSAGQRCSALRVLYLQEEIAARVIAMLVGAMRCLKIGAPADLATDVGPVISQAAQQRLQQHAARMRAEAKLLYACELDASLAPGHFFAPQLFELHSLDQLRSEEFGPILHLARYRSGELPQVLEAIRSTGFGLTLGVHSRLESVARHVFRSLPVGNTYVNRNMIGAVVGVQPCGGQGLSGTGPKAGGPHYLLRFATERTLTLNTAAIGGNVELLS